MVVQAIRRMPAGGSRIVESGVRRDGPCPRGSWKKLMRRRKEKESSRRREWVRSTLLQDPR